MNINEAREYLYSLVGTPYLLGSADPMRGLDCYTLIKLFALKMGVELPDLQYSEDWASENPEFYSNGFKEYLKPVQPPFKTGDIILLRVYNAASHAGIILEDNKMIHATKINGVMISSVNNNFYKKRIVSAGRFKQWL